MVKNKKYLVSNKVLNVSFMFPVTSGVMGGVQMLLINIIQYLSNNESINVRLYDYKTGLIKDKLDELGVENYEFISLDESDWSINNKGDEVFVLTDFLWLKYPYFFKNKDVKLLMWDVYYPRWDNFYKVKNIPLPLLKERTLNLLEKHQAVIFVEQLGLDKLKVAGKLKQFGSELVVPIPINVSNEHCLINRYEQVNKDRISFGYIGRAENWKIQPVNKLLLDLSKMDSKFSVYIYTNNVDEFARNIIEYENIRIIYKQNLWGDKLEIDLKNNIDVGFAMGTAALDFAKLGFPTILADFSSKPFPENYKYRYIFDASKGNVGLDVKDVVSDVGRYSLEDIVQNLDMKHLSFRSYQYVMKNHGIDVVVEKLIDACNRTSLTYNKINSPILKFNKLLYLVKRIVRKSRNYYGWGIH